MKISNYSQKLVPYLNQPINYLLWLSFLPVIFISCTFIVFEITLALELRVNNFTFKILLILFGLITTWWISINFKKVFELKTEKNYIISWIDLLISIVSCIYILVTYINFHYVTPSASVLYYLFFDYFRYFIDTGFVRPELPTEYPGGTWYSMQTYNPSIGYLVMLFSNGDSFESYRQSFGLIGGMFHISALGWLGLLTKRVLNFASIGVLLGTCIFFFYPKIGLFQSLLLIGSHDFPFLYFAVALFVLFIFFIYEKDTHSPEVSITLILLVSSFFVIGISLRPYLISMIFIPLSMVIYFLFKNKHRLVSIFFCFTEKNVVTMNIILTGLILVGLYWFFVLILMYNTPVVYNFSQHLGVDTSLTYQLGILKSIFLNNAGSLTFVSDLNMIVVGIIFLTSLLGMLLSRKYDLLLYVLLCAVLFLVSPILTTSGIHWKSYIPFIVGIYVLAPILLLSYYLKFFHKTFTYIFLIIIIVAQQYIFLNYSNVLPKDMTKVIQRDNGFRQQVANIVNKGEKIFVLRGGEPGGDSQSFIPNYYYWNNVFLFGDVDKYIEKELPDAHNFVCELNRRQVKFIFNPENLGLKNHSGQKVYSYIKDLLKNNTDKFEPIIKRTDGYKGVFYRITDVSVANCNK